MILAWTVTGLVTLGAVGGYWQGTKMEKAETVKLVTVPVRQSPTSDFKIVDMGLFKVQKVRDGKAVRSEILKVEIEIYKDRKIGKLDQISPRLREDFYMALRRKMTRVRDKGPISFNSPKLKKKLISLARKRLGKSAVHDVKVIDHKKAVRKMIKKRKSSRKKGLEGALSR